MYLLDTNICIYAIKRQNPGLLKKIKKESDSGLYISSLTIAELEYGVSNSLYPEKNRIALLKFISFFEILPFDEQDAIRYGEIKTDLKKKGNLIGPIDMLLAGQAIARELTMVTNNIKEFKRVKGLKAEDWS